ncbi:MAG: hypothetical protein ACLFUJ_02950 [Phycisphaerae bacterium]
MPHTALIVGNGPSVEQLASRKRSRPEADDVLVVGVNRVLALAATWDLRFDALLIRDTWRRLWDRPDLARRYHQLWQAHPAWKIGPADRRITRCDQFVRFADGWQDRVRADSNGETAVIQAPSAVLAAANWAWLQGARRLLLVGVDYAGGYPRRLAPYDEQTPGSAAQYDKPVREDIERAFAQARSAIEQAGGSIWNLSPESRLKALARCDWSEVMGR